MSTVKKSLLRLFHEIEHELLSAGLVHYAVGCRFERAYLFLLEEKNSNQNSVLQHTILLIAFTRNINIKTRRRDLWVHLAPNRRPRKSEVYFFTFLTSSFCKHFLNDSFFYSKTVEREGAGR